MATRPNIALRCTITAHKTGDLCECETRALTYPCYDTVLVITAHRDLDNDTLHGRTSLQGGGGYDDSICSVA